MLGFLPAEHRVRGLLCQSAALLLAVAECGLQPTSDKQTSLPEQETFPEKNVTCVINCVPALPQLTWGEAHSGAARTAHVSHENSECLTLSNML
jgi:hypothetical protein